MLSVRRRRSILGSALLAASLVISPVAARAQQGTARPAARPAPVAGAGTLIPGLPGLDPALWISWLAVRWLGARNPASLLGAATAADSAGSPPASPPPGGGTGVGSSNGLLVDPNG
jgi:hypothetical protein